MAMIIEGEGPSKFLPSKLLLLQSLAVGSGYQPVNNRSSLYEMGNVKIIAATYGWKGTMIATGITVIEAKEDSIVILNILMIAIGLGTMILKAEITSVPLLHMRTACLYNESIVGFYQDATTGRLKRLLPVRLRGLLLEEKAHYMGNDNGRGIERRNTPKEKEKSEGKHQGDVSKI
ncbi:hypothetical protein OsJ_08733 [Oryza sativa Japonica Group]|uniref:Uncharacterized protein n=1 Tax=Oryza sativa subsp. japonica TaxID=39947 RepID=B9F418_ORYSJ|nr:hypothetical protein OsJ_08733 [Oryza sativa Japonica Group]